VVAQLDKRYVNITVLCWSGMTEHNDSYKRKRRISLSIFYVLGDASSEGQFCHSSPNLLALASAVNRYSIFTNGIFKVYTSVSCDNDCELEVLQNAKNSKTWESLFIRLNDNNITLDNVSILSI